MKQSKKQRDKKDHKEKSVCKRSRRRIPPMTNPMVHPAVHSEVRILHAARNHLLGHIPKLSRAGDRIAKVIPRIEDPVAESISRQTSRKFVQQLLLDFSLFNNQL